MEKLISVVIPAYNAQDFIRGCLEKVLSQDYDNFEVIVVNDGSKDKTQEIAQQYAAKDERVRVLNQENSGTCIARLNGVNIAKGKYIMFLDSDDFYVDGALKKVAEIIRKYNTDIVKYRFQTYPKLEPQKLIFGQEDVVLTKNEFKEKLYPLYIYSYSLNGITSLAIKKSLLKVEDIESYRGMRYGEDLKLTIELYDKIDSIVIVPDIIYNYYANDNSVTRTKNAQRLLGSVKCFAKVYTQLCNYLEKWEVANKDNMKVMYIKILNEMAGFYTKIIDGEDQDFVHENYEEIRASIYSDLTLKAIDNLSIEDLNKEDKLYDMMLKIYNKQI